MIHDSMKFVLSDIARQIAEDNFEIDRWGGMVIYFLEALEIRAMDLDPDHPQEYEQMLSDLAAVIAGRLDEGHW